jgi:hypothetical protein
MVNSDKGIRTGLAANIEKRLKRSVESGKTRRERRKRRFVHLQQRLNKKLKMKKSRDRCVAINNPFTLRN